MNTLDIYNGNQIRVRDWNELFVNVGVQATDSV